MGCHAFAELVGVQRSTCMPTDLAQCACAGVRHGGIPRARRVRTHVQRNSYKPNRERVGMYSKPRDEISVTPEYRSGSKIKKPKLSVCATLRVMSKLLCGDMPLHRGPISVRGAGFVDPIAINKAGSSSLLLSVGERVAQPKQASRRFRLHLPPPPASHPLKLP